MMNRCYPIRQFYFSNHHLITFLVFWICLISCKPKDLLGQSGNQSPGKNKLLSADSDAILEELARLPFSGQNDAAKIPLKMKLSTLKWELRACRNQIEKLANQRDQFSKRLNDLEHHRALLLEDCSKRFEDSFACSIENADSLTQNALIELQRIEWELASQAAYENKEKGEDPKELKIARLKIEAQRRHLEGLALIHEANEKSLARLKSLYDNGTISVGDVDKLVAQANASKLQMNDAMSELKLLETQSESSTEVDKVSNLMKQLTLRKDSIRKQLSKLAEQRKLLIELKSIESRIDTIAARSLQAENQIFDLQEKIEEKEGYRVMIEEALKDAETQDSEKK